MKRNVRILPWLLCCTLLLWGCAGSRGAGEQSALENEEKLNVVTTLFPYYDFVRQIGGDKVELTMVIPAGMDSHSFEPTPADILTIQNADVLVCNGGEMEHWLGQVLEALDTSHMTVAVMMDYVETVVEETVEGMEEEDGHGHGHGARGQAEEGLEKDGETAGTENGRAEGKLREAGEADWREKGREAEIEYDEHIWTSPVNSMKLAQAIADTLAEADPANREVYESGAGQYLKRLEKLDKDLRKVMDHRKRDLIVVGDRFPFRYLAEEYGLRYRAAFSGCSSDTEPSAQTIAYLIDKIREEKIPAVYYLELSSKRVSEIIAEETGAEPLLLHSCHNVTRQEFDGGITYVGLMEQNIENLRKGLDE